MELSSASRTRGTTSSTVLSGLGSNYGGAQSHQPWSQSKGTEIEKIMAKIEQDNRILAELDHSRSTTLGEFWFSLLSLTVLIQGEPMHKKLKIYIISKRSLSRYWFIQPFYQLRHPVKLRALL